MATTKRSVDEELTTKASVMAPHPSARENSLVNRKLYVDEIKQQVVRSRHQLVNFESDELRFMTNLKRKVYMGMANV